MDGIKRPKTEDGRPKTEDGRPKTEENPPDSAGGKGWVIWIY
jgi:hypothetical protein